MVFIIRVQTKQGVKRLMFKDDKATWEDLYLQVCQQHLHPEHSLQTSPPFSRAVVSAYRHKTYVGCRSPK
jgi:hypothetical protein